MVHSFAYKCRKGRMYVSSILSLMVDLIGDSSTEKFPSGKPWMSLGTKFLASNSIRAFKLSNNV